MKRSSVNSDTELHWCHWASSKRGIKVGKAYPLVWDFTGQPARSLKRPKKVHGGVFCLALGVLIASMHLAGLFLEQDSVTEGRTVDVSAMGTPDGSGSCPEHPSPVGLS